MTILLDQLDRPLRDLRISVTDRCNFRCIYCIPKEVYGANFAFLPRDDVLTFEEIDRLANIFVEHGADKIRITGGEPLLRRDTDKLIGLVAHIDGLRDLTLTTNAALLKQKARALKDAGLNRITVSLDSLKDETIMAMNDVNFPVRQVLEGIEAAVAVGLQPVKINLVVERRVNDQDILEMARLF